MDNSKAFANAVCAGIDAGAVSSHKDLQSLKARLSGQYGFSGAPSNPDILMWADDPSRTARLWLSIKAVRTLSGVAPVAIMTKPIDCRHGTCIYCPGGEKSVFGAIPKSYTGNEPASMRAVSNRFDGFLQVFNRLYQLVATGHSVQKIELVLMGGTFPSFPRDYQDAFVCDAFWAANTFSDWFFPGGTLDAAKFAAFFGSSGHGDSAALQAELLAFKQQHPTTLSAEQERNESSFCRLVAFCIETKPDYSLAPHIDAMLSQGCTRVELGIQCLDGGILAFTNRGHTLADSVSATAALKDSCLKVTYHLMPGLPHSSPEKDVDMFRELFGNPAYRPDALKIYPCMVMPGTPLFELHRRGEFEPLSTQQAVEIIANAKRFFPKWVRVQRVMRDIPTKLSIGGVRSNNLRQLVVARAAELGISCKCIRCREVGHSPNASRADIARAQVLSESYAASGGTEVFLSAEDVSADVLFGFCRLRIPSAPFRPEIGPDSALIRELHVFGKSQSFGASDDSAAQHHGLGARLLQEAERIAKADFGKSESIVVSGVGARDYYRRLGYARKGVFMAKRL